MGLDKKPTPPPKRVKDEGGGGGEESVTSPKDGPEMETGQTREDAVSHSDCKTSQPQDMKTQVKQPTSTEEDKVKDGIRTETSEQIKHDCNQKFYICIYIFLYFIFIYHLSQ